jgi:predicted RNA-binding Zn-ribbon protein involved in translation (DUF1610 family)
VKALVTAFESAVAKVKPQTLMLVRRCPDCGCHDEHEVAIISNTAECNACGYKWGVRIPGRLRTAGFK